MCGADRSATVGQLLQPWTVLFNMLFPSGDVVEMLHRHTDIIETFEQGNALRRPDLNREFGAIRSDDTLVFEIRGERGCAIGRLHNRFEGGRASAWRVAAA